MRHAVPLVAMLTCAAPAVAVAQATLPPDFVDQLVVGGLSTPTGMAPLPDGRVLVTEQLTAKIRLIVNGVLAATDPVVVVPAVRNDNFFRGLLGIAVDPRWPSPPYVYVHFAASNGKLMISRFTASGDLAFTGNGSLTIDPMSRYDLFGDLYDAAHNGGTLRFGPDGMLYASVGDSIDRPCAAQNLATMRGVVMRLEVRNLPAGPGGPPSKALLTPPDNPFVGHPSASARLAWVRGLRNPFRFQIDRANGDLFISDVGENVWEEIDHAPVGGLNFGWPLYEGPDPFTSCPGVPGTGLTGPIHAYGDGMSVIGAGVYHRPSSLALGFPRAYEGDYFFSDFYNGALRRIRNDGSGWSASPPVPGQPNATDWASGMREVSDYWMAPDGSLWYCRQSVGFTPNTGSIRRIAYTGVLDVRDGIPSGITFAPPHPSPSQGRVDLTYSLPERMTVELSIFDLAGRRIQCVEPRARRGPGLHRATWDGHAWDGRRVTPGLYLARLLWEGGAKSQRIVIAR